MKKTLNIKVLASVIIVCVILAIANIAKAYSVNGSLYTPDKLIAGDEVAITLSFSDIDMADGIRSITIDKVDYDTAVFEAITSSSFVGSSGWSASYNADNGKATLINMNPVTQDSAVFTLNLRVKSSITATKSTVTFKNIVASAGTQTTGNIPVGSKNVTLHQDTAAEYNTVTTPDPDTNSGSGAGTDSTPAQDQAAGQQQGAKDNKTTNTKKITASKSDKKILKAGDGTTIILSAVGIVVFAVAIVGFVKYAKNKDIK